jgi:hypothetical protein
MNLATQIVLSVIDKMLQPTNADPLVMPERNECDGGVFDYVEIVAKKIQLQTQNAANSNAEVVERMSFLRGQPIINTSCPQQ